MSTAISSYLHAVDAVVGDGGEEADVVERELSGGAEREAAHYRHEREVHLPNEEGGYMARARGSPGSFCV